MSDHKLVIQYQNSKTKAKWLAIIMFSPISVGERFCIWLCAVSRLPIAGPPEWQLIQTGLARPACQHVRGVARRRNEIKRDTNFLQPSLWLLKPYFQGGFILYLSVYIDISLEKEYFLTHFTPTYTVLSGSKSHLQFVTKIQIPASKVTFKKNN